MAWRTSPRRDAAVRSRRPEQRCQQADEHRAAGSLLTELFPPQLRYSGVAIAFDPGGVVNGFRPETQLAGRKRGWEEDVMPLADAVSADLNRFTEQLSA
ncbi:hypothetical protein [Saccharopolyspora hattusasensis]|uniref:hypothetical protein n=1 Tax=Saccharopolyspora hattusasensis TaxID=1128679 RepID=UPI003D958BC2